MALTRRQFLALALGTIGAAGAGLYLSTSRDAVFDDATGTLDDHTLRTLDALAATYAGDYGSTGHYRLYFAWRAENLPGYLSTYRVFAATLDAAAQDSGTSFADADNATRHDLLYATLQMPEPTSDLFAPTYEQPETLFGLEAEIWARFHRMIIAELVYVFINTNAWIMLGYDGWMSQPRGLETYTQPPQT